jgi:inosose dehydratase
VRMIANAPVSFGVFEPGAPPVAAAEMVSALAEAGYDGIDLGPLGYLDLDQLGGLSLAGGWVDVPQGSFADLDATLDAFDRAPAAAFKPVPTLGPPAMPARFARPGRGVPEMTDWPAFAARVQATVEFCRERGYEPALHPHLGHAVETPDEIERLLELTDVRLCLDTGHLLLAGGDPVKALRDWSGRIGQVHVKDASFALFGEGGDIRQMMGRGVFTPVGAGDLDLPGVVAALGDYEGWIVVEQDTLPGHRPTEEIVADQAANLAKLKELGL